VVVAAAATYFISSRQQKQYVANTSVYVETADPTLNIGGGSAPQGPPMSQSLADVAQLITAQSVTSAVAQTLGVPVSFARTMTATPGTDLSFVTVTATSHSPVLAARLANAYALVFLRSRQGTVAAAAGRDLRAAQATLASLPNGSTASDISQRQMLLQQIETYGQTTLNLSAGARLKR
jgi:capsular polysaccharide biosynthesis protein